MKHFIYRITNKLNQRYYVGMHSTSNVDDGYLGSGRRIKAEVKKYGKENFEKVILEELPTRKALEDREREIVNEQLRSDPLCLNLKNGGEGGGGIFNEEHKRIFQLAGAKAAGKKMGPINFKFCITEEAVQKKNDTIRSRFDGWTFSNRAHTEETKVKMRASHKGLQDGEKNSQFGSCWVTDGVKPIKIKKEQLDEFILKGYRRGRK